MGSKSEIDAIMTADAATGRRFLSDARIDQMHSYSLGKRERDVLRKLGVETLGDLSKVTALDLARMKGCGTVGMKRLSTFAMESGAWPVANAQQEQPEIRHDPITPRDLFIAAAMIALGWPEYWEAGGAYEKRAGMVMDYADALMKSRAR